MRCLSAHPASIARRTDQRLNDLRFSRRGLCRGCFALPSSARPMPPPRLAGDAVPTPSPSSTMKSRRSSAATRPQSRRIDRRRRRQPRSADAGPRRRHADAGRARAEADAGPPHARRAGRRPCRGRDRRRASMNASPARSISNPRASRSQGQLSVAEVVLNRTRSGRFPSSICGVVKQRGQFSFIRGGRFPADRRASSPPGARRSRSPRSRCRISPTARRRAPCSSTPPVSPGWRGLTRVATVGNHIFYR